MRPSESRRQRYDAAIEEADLTSPLHFPFEHMCVDPPAKPADGIQVMRSFDLQASGGGQLPYGFASVAAMMSQLLVDGAI